MKLHLFFILGLSDFAISDRPEETSDVEKLLEAIALGKGLYSEFPYIQPLNTSNFDQVVRGKSSSWLIEFYNSWCGDCIRFMTTFKRVSADISGWKDDIQVGAVDCFQDANVPICREFDIIRYPTMKYFPPKFTKEDGIRVKSKDEAKIRSEVARLIGEEKGKKFLQPFSGDLKALRSQKLKKAYWVVLVVDCGTVSNLGIQLALDYRNIGSQVKVVSTSCENRKLLNDLDPPFSKLLPSSTPAVYIVLKTGSSLVAAKTNRNEILATLAQYFSYFGIKSPTPFPLDTIKDIKIRLRDALAYALKHHTLPLHKKIPTDEVFRVDIEGALKHTLTNEIAGRDEISGDKFDALEQYLLMQKKFFPFGLNGVRFLACIIKKVNEFKQGKRISGSQFYDIVNNCEEKNYPVYREKGKLWLGCRGIVLLFRGFPCGMWQMYHTLTVSAALKHSRDPLEVHMGMEGYVKNFFGCSNCVENFLKDAVSIPQEVKNHKDSVLWLWRKHNKVNHRLHGDQTEDPKFPKVQFPLETSCPKCHKSDGQFNEINVLKFLQKMYSNFSNETLSDYISHKAGQRSLIYQSLYDHDNVENAVFSGAKSLYGEENYCKANW